MGDFSLLTLSLLLSEFTQTHVHRVSDAIQPSHPLLSPFFSCLQSPSIRVFSNESVLPIRWPKYWSFSFSVSPPNEYSGLTSFRIYWFDLLSVQGTLKSLLQNYNLKASILWPSAFFMVQLSYPYMTIGKTIALTIRFCFCLGWPSLAFFPQYLSHTSSFWAQNSVFLPIDSQVLVLILL